MHQQSAARAAATAAVKRAADAATAAASALQQLLHSLPPANEDQKLLLASVSASASAAAASASAAAALLAQLDVGATALAPVAMAAMAAAAPLPQQQQQHSVSSRSMFSEPIYIQDGAAELQNRFDDAVSQLAIVCWHAAWSDHCEAAAAALEALAEQHPAVAFFLLDVEGSSANTAFALEKVMGRPESRRIGEQRRAGLACGRVGCWCSSTYSARHEAVVTICLPTSCPPSPPDHAGAKPVLRAGSQKWPCFTLHYPPSLEAAYTFTGPEALEQLAVALAEHGSHESAEVSEQDAATVEAMAEAKHAAAAAPALAAAGGAPSDYTADSGLAQLTHGAAQLKELLLAAKTAGSALALIWVRDGDAASAALRKAAAQVAAELAAEAASGDCTSSSIPRLVLADASPSRSKANERLAAALGVAPYPCVQLYRNMKAVQRLAGPGEATPSAMRALVGLPEAVEPDTKPATAATTASPAGADGSSEAAVGDMQVDDPYAPPSGKFARANAIKRMPSGAMGQ